MNKKSDFYVPKLIVCIAGILFGCFMVIYGILNWFYYGSDFVDNMKFGGDFYTEQHAATASAANNLGAIHCTIDDIARIMFVAVGVAFILGFLLSLFVIIGNHNRYKAVQNKASSVNLMAQEFLHN